MTPLTISKWENDSLYTPKKKTIIKAAKYFDVFERCFDVTISMRLINKEHDMDLSDKIIEWILKRYYED